MIFINWINIQRIENFYTNSNEEMREKIFFFVIIFLLIEGCIWYPTIYLMFDVIWEKFWEKLPWYNDDWIIGTIAMFWYVFLFQIAVALAIYILYLIYKSLFLSGHQTWNWRTCYDKTSIDYNWQNDMKCINNDWKIVRTDYEWADILMWK